MPLPITGVPGGALKTAVGTSAVAIDLTALAQCAVKIFSKTDDLLFCFAADASSTTLLDTSAGDQAASLTTLNVDGAANGIGVVRTVSPKWPFLIVKHVTNTGTIYVKRVAHKDVSQ